MNIDDDRLETSKSIQRRTGRTFHVATRGLPEETRHATYVLYAFFRVADDVVDDPEPGPPAAQLAELERIRAAALGEVETDDPVLSAFAEVRERYGIPREEVETFVGAMAADVDPVEYDTYADLEGYLRGSSVAVANMMLHVMNPDEFEAARPHARALAEAFQLTNFLRDVREDVVEYDRIYLPLETLAAHGVDVESIRDLEFSPAFADAMRAELRRAEDLYRDGVRGIHYLPEGVQFAVLLSAVLYADHHRLIRQRGYDVLSATPELSQRRRLWLAARTWFHHRLGRDPVATFHRLTDVPRDPPVEALESPADHEIPTLGPERAGTSTPRSR